MKEDIKILIVENHPMTSWSYESILKLYNQNYNWSFDKVNNGDKAFKLLNLSKKDPYHIVLLALNLPPHDSKNIFDAEELGVKIKKQHPAIKILVITMLNDKLRVNSIVKSFRPKGLILKNEITPELLHDSIIKLLSNKTAYSKGASKLLTAIAKSSEEINIYDRKILYYISIGEKMKNLPKLLPLSISTIERRKRRLKGLFGIEQGDDHNLVSVAKEKGFI